MEPKFQTSFIPKSSVVMKTTDIKSPTTVTLLPIVATVMLILSILSAGGIFFYQQYLGRKIIQANDALVLAQAAFEPKIINELMLVSDQIKSVKELLEKHIIVSNLFTIFQSSTIPSVRFTTFTFERKENGLITVGIEGEGASYSHVAKQAEILSSSDFVKNVFFSRLSLNDKNIVIFKLSADVDDKAISYQEALKRLSIIN